MKKQGTTIIELLVAMAIFTIVVTIAVGAFVAVANMKALTSTMKESQQKTRIALEMTTRLSRQAQKVITYPDGQKVDLYFNLGGVPYGSRFEIKNDTEGKKTLYYSECEGSLNCTTWTDEVDLYGGIEIVNGGFTKTGTIPPILNITLDSRIGDIGSDEYYSDEINVETSVILEGIK